MYLRRNKNIYVIDVGGTKGRLAGKMLMWEYTRNVSTLMTL